MSQLVPSAINGVVIDKRGANFIDCNFQQYLLQDPEDPKRGWGIFGDVTYGGGNPNVLQWSTSIGIGGNSLVPGRPDDRFGVSYFYFGFSEPLRQSLKPVFNLRLSLASSYSTISRSRGRSVLAPICNSLSRRPGLLPTPCSRD